MLCHFMSCFFGFLLEWHAIVLTSFFLIKSRWGGLGLTTFIDCRWGGLVLWHFLPASSFFHPSILFFFSFWLVLVFLFLTIMLTFFFSFPFYGFTSLGFAHCAWADMILVLLFALLVLVLRYCYANFFKFLISLYYLS